MICSRYVPLLCALLVAALVPTVIHSYAGMKVDDGRTTTVIPIALAGFTSAPTDRNDGWGKRRFESDDWFERRYVSGRDEAVLTVIRSYDLKRLYHHPELAVAYGTAFVEHEVVRFPERTDIPVHVLRTRETNRPAVAMYVLHHGDSFVDAPIWFQLRTAGELLVGGRRAMTLIFVNDVSVPEDANVATLPSRTLLMEATDAFVSAKTAVNRRGA